MITYKVLNEFIALNSYAIMFRMRHIRVYIKEEDLQESVLLINFNFKVISIKMMLRVFESLRCVSFYLNYCIIVN